MPAKSKKTTSATPKRMGRPPKAAQDRSPNVEKMTLATTAEGRNLLERLGWAMSAKVGRKLTVLEAVLLALEESPSYQAILKGR